MVVVPQVVLVSILRTGTRCSIIFRCVRHLQCGKQHKRCMAAALSTGLGRPGSRRRGSRRAAAAGAPAPRPGAAPRAAPPRRPQPAVCCRRPHPLQPPLLREAAAAPTCGSPAGQPCGPGSRTPARMQRCGAAEPVGSAHAGVRVTSHAILVTSHTLPASERAGMHSRQRRRTARAFASCSAARRCAKDAARPCRKLERMSSWPRCRLASAHALSP